MITSLITAFVLRMIDASAYAAVKLIIETARLPLAFIYHDAGRETGSLVGSIPGSRR
jgi:hypothetical protein